MPHHNETKAIDSNKIWAKTVSVKNKKKVLVLLKLAPSFFDQAFCSIFSPKLNKKHTAKLKIIMGSKFSFIQCDLL